MAKTPIEDLQPKGTRLFENHALAISPQYTGLNHSGRLIECGKDKQALVIPIKNKRGKKGGAVSSTYEISGLLVENTPTAGPSIIVNNNLTNAVDLQLKMVIPTPPTVDTLVLVTFEFDKNHTHNIPGKPHYGWENKIDFNGYKAGKTKINGGFNNMYDFPIILEKGATEVIFYAKMAKPVDAIIKVADAKRPLGIFGVQYVDTSIIYYDHAKKQHVSEDVPAQSDFKIEDKKVSNIITKTGAHSANGPLLKKLDADAEMFARYILTSGAFDPKDPLNPIPDATRYYPCAEDNTTIYDMLSRAYVSELRLKAKKGVAQSKVIFNVSAKTKIKVNGIEYVFQPGNSWQGVTVNNALNDGDIICTFEDARLITGFRIFNNASADSFIGGFPDLTLFPNLDTVMLRKASFQGPFPPNTWTNKIVNIDKPAHNAGGIAYMREFGEDWDMSGATNPALTAVKLDQVHCSTITLPKQLEQVLLYGINIGAGATPKEQTWEFLIDGMTKLKTFDAWDARGVVGHMPKTIDSPLLEGYGMGYSNAGVLNPISVFGLPSFDENPKLKSIHIAWCDNNVGAHRLWWTKNEAGKPFPEPWGSHVPTFKNSHDVETITLNFLMNPVKNGTKYQYIPDWSKCTKMKKLSLSYPSKLQGEIIPAHWPVSLTSITIDESTAVSAQIVPGPKGEFTKAFFDRLVNLTSFGYARSNTLNMDTSILTGNKHLVDVDLSSTGYGADQKYGTLCDLSSMTALAKFNMNKVRKGMTGSLKVGPGLTKLVLGGADAGVADRSEWLKLDGGFPNMAANKFTELRIGQTTIGHEGASKNHLPTLTAAKATLTTLSFYNMPNIVDNMPDLANFPQMIHFTMLHMDAFTQPIPSIGVSMRSDKNGHSVNISGNKNITGYGGTATSKDGNIKTKEIKYQDNNLTAVAVENILIAFSKGGALGGTSLYLDNPVYEASKAAHAKDPAVVIQPWRNKAPDLNKPAVAKAIADLKTKTVKVFLPI